MISRKIALIPAFEPDGNLLYLCEELHKRDYTIIIVNDGSDSFYDELFEKAGALATVLSYQTNRGKGYALRYGLSHIRNNYGENSVIVTLDADGQHTPTDAGRVLAAVGEHPQALVLGSRSFTGDVPARSRFGNTLTRAVFAVSTGHKISDTQTGLRAFSYGMIDRLLDVKGDRYEYEMNMLMDFVADGIPIIEIPIATIYQNNNASSHFHAVKDSYRIYKEILKYVAASFTSFLLDYGLFAAFTLLFSRIGILQAAVAANICARIISATFNFTVNRHLVFKDSGSIHAAALRYAALAAGILFANTMLLRLLTEPLAVNVFLAKILTETTLFAASFFFQKTLVFCGDKKNGGRLRLTDGTITE